MMFISVRALLGFKVFKCFRCFRMFNVSCLVWGVLGCLRFLGFVYHPHCLSLSLSLSLSAPLSEGARLSRHGLRERITWAARVQQPSPQPSEADSIDIFGFQLCPAFLYHPALFQLLVPSGSSMSLQHSEALRSTAQHSAAQHRAGKLTGWLAG